MEPLILLTRRLTVILTRLKVAFPAPAPGAFAFAVRTTVASLIALYIAFEMNLDEPVWAATTVWIVAQASRGMGISKSQYRISGTAIGAVVALALISAFAQTPELLLLALAMWVGLCTSAATFLRNFRAYAAVLAGYTAAIISMGAAADPRQAFDIAIARFLYIAVGILTEAALTTIFVRDTALPDLRARLFSYIRRAGDVATRTLRREPTRDAVHRLFSDALGLDNAAEYASSESSEARQVTGHLRTATLAVLTASAAAQTIEEHRKRHPYPPEPLIEEAAAMIEQRNVPSSEYESLIHRIEQALLTATRSSSASVTSRLLLLDRIHVLLTAFKEAGERKALIDEPSPPRFIVRYAYHNDAILAVQNGLRAFIAMIAASTFWMLSAWPSGAAFVATVAVVCALFSTRTNSVHGALGFLKGSALAAIVAAVCNFALFPAISDFIPLCLVVAVFTITAGVAMRYPSTAAIGSAFSIFFWNFTALNNTSRIGDAAFLNGALSTLLAISFGAMVFMLVFPYNPLANRRRMHRAVRRDLTGIAREPYKWTASEWLSRTADRMSRALTLADTRSRKIAEDDLGNLLATWTIGDCVLKLASLHLQGQSTRRAVDVIRKRLARGQFARAARSCESAAHHLRLQMRIHDPVGHPLLTGVVTLESIRDAISAHIEFLQSEV
ncbi:FUSC family protein [Paraburkholderia silvatlantica]|uniref:Putative membrane protein YccC n=1 Tax=Paraburkholderia silvatlantica TaxID=321895 RepID=A0A2V4TRR4_9BURK|nr:FUSC family protein [Paraburkholderia silvatlantica]PYE21234.1 putative membrane protein YccC [Paraburkholderia silvatlantica]TDQ86625.1 putative membrane protein YccC [Paraburkholderia silvatlantica]